MDSDDDIQVLVDSDNEDTDDFESCISDLLGLSACNYIEERDLFKFFNSHDKMPRDCIDLMHINARSLNANFPKILNLLSINKCKPSVLAITETWLNESNYDLFQIDGFKFINLNRQGSKVGGGVGIYVDVLLDVVVRNDMSVTNNILECIFIELSCKKYLNSGKVLIGCIYRPPGGDPSSFTDALAAILNGNKRKYKASLLTGDFNLDLLKSSQHLPTQDFVDMLASSSYIPSITKPTRITDSTATLLDNVFINAYGSKFESAVVYSDISDHFPILLKMNVKIVDKTGCTHSKKRHLTGENIKFFREELKLVNWNLVINNDCINSDPDSAYTKFSDLITKIYNETFKLEDVKLPKHRIPRQEWITPGLVSSCHHKSKPFKNFKLNPTPINENIYKKYRNKLKIILDLAEKSYYTDKIKSCTGDHKQLWKILNSLISKKKHSNPVLNFLINGQTITDSSIIVRKFNEFFVSIGPNLTSNIPVAQNDCLSYLKGSYINSFYLSPSDMSEVVSVTNSLCNKHSSGVDEIPVSIMKQTIDLLAVPLSTIINVSFCTGIVPKKLKIAKVCPVYKTGSKNEISNYRPISILPSFSKTFEKIVYKRLNEYFLQLNIIIPNQYGFRSNHSTSMALLDLYDKVTESLDQKNMSLGYSSIYKKLLTQLTMTYC